MDETGKAGLASISMIRNVFVEMEQLVKPAAVEQNQGFSRFELWMNTVVY